MLKKTIKFQDFNGIERSEDLYFHVAKTAILTAPDEIYDEIITIGKELQERGELLQTVEGTINKDDPFDANSILLAESMRMVARLLDRLIDLSYGKRSEDGSRFIKNPDVLKDFKQSAAYDAFIEQMITSQDEMVQFINQLLVVN